MRRVVGEHDLFNKHVDEVGAVGERQLLPVGVQQFDLDLETVKLAADSDGVMPVGFVQLFIERGDVSVELGFALFKPFEVRGIFSFQLALGRLDIQIGVVGQHRLYLHVDLRLKVYLCIDQGVQLFASLYKLEVEAAGFLLLVMALGMQPLAVVVEVVGGF